MPRYRKPTNILELKGAFKHDPARGRERANEPKPTALIEKKAPAWMTKRQQECYLEVIAKSHANVLASADSALVELTATLLDEFRDDPRKFSGAKVAMLLNCLGRMGMTPSDRSKVAAIPTDPANNPYAEFGT